MKFDSPRELDEFLLPLPNKNEKGDNSIYTCDANAMDYIPGLKEK